MFGSLDVDEITSQAPAIHSCRGTLPIAHGCSDVTTIVRKWILLRQLFARSLGRIGALNCVKIISIVEKYLETSLDKNNLSQKIAFASGEDDCVQPYHEYRTAI